MWRRLKMIGEAYVIARATEFATCLARLASCAIAAQMEDEFSPRRSILEGNVDAAERNALEVLAKIDAECGGKVYGEFMKVLQETIRRMR